jgi:hypothetical protein
VFRKVKETASVYVQKYFITTLLINVAGPCRYVQNGADFEEKKNLSTEHLPKL